MLQCMFSWNRYYTRNSQVQNSSYFLSDFQITRILIFLQLQSLRVYQFDSRLIALFHPRFKYFSSGTGNYASFLQSTFIDNLLYLKYNSASFPSWMWEWIFKIIGTWRLTQWSFWVSFWFLWKRYDICYSNPKTGRSCSHHFLIALLYLPNHVTYPKCHLGQIPCYRCIECIDEISLTINTKSARCWHQ